MGIAEKLLKVRGQRSKSWLDQFTCIGRGVHFNSVASRLTYFKNF